MPTYLPLPIFTAAPSLNSSNGSLPGPAAVAPGPRYGHLEGVSTLPGSTQPAGPVSESGDGSSGAWSGSGFDLEDPASELDDPGSLKYGAQEVLLVDTSPAQYGER